MNKKKKIIIGVVAAVLIVVVIVVIKMSSSGGGTDVATETGTQVEPLAKHDMSASINATGTVESQNVVSVTTDLTSKCTQLNVALGDYVEAGEVLCVFDDTDIKSQISDLEAQASSAEKLAAKNTEIANRGVSDAKADQQTKLAAAQTAINNATDTYNSVLNIYNSMADGEEKNAYYSETVVAAKTAVDSANSDYATVVSSTNSAIQSAQDTADTTALSSTTDSTTTKSLSDLYRQLNEVTVTAEQSGIVTSLSIAQGGIATNGAIMEIQDNSNLKVKVSIKEKDILKVQEGMNANITADAVEDETATGSVSKVIDFATAGTTASDGTTSGGGYFAEITLDPGSQLLLGMTAKVEIMLKAAQSELSVAYDSIMTDEDGTTYVYKAEDQGDGTYMVVREDVTVGDESDYYTAITSDDLKLGDLIISYPETVTEGDIITVTQTSASGNATSTSTDSSESTTTVTE